MAAPLPSGDSSKPVAFDEAYDPLIIAENNRISFNNRIAVSVLLGVGAGVLGLENLWGVVFYFVGSAVGAFIFLTVTVGLGKQSIYFTKWTDMITSTLSTNLFTFVMIWTLFYDIVHVYV